MLRLAVVSCVVVAIYAQTEIWSSYESGECDAMQKKTFEVLETLSAADKITVFGPPPLVAVPDAFTTVPMFIRMMNEDTKKAFDAIWLNATLDENVKYTEIEEFGKKNFEGEQLADFTRWLAEVKKHKSMIDERIAKLSPEAKAILDKLVKTRAEERRLLDSITPQLATELHGLI